MPRQKCGLQPRTSSGIHQPDLRHPAQQHIRHRHKIGQRSHPGGQRLHCVEPRQGHPPRPARQSNYRRPQVIGQSRPQRLFIARPDRQHIQNLPTFAGVTRHQPGQCRHFRPQRIGLALGLGPHRTRFGLARLGVGTGGFGVQQCRIGLGGGGDGGQFGLPGGGKILLGFGQGRLCPGLCGLGLCGLGSGPGQRLAAIFQHPLRRLVPRGQPGHVFGLLAQCGLLGLQHRRRVPGQCRRHLKPSVMPLCGLGDFGGFPVQPGNGVACIAVQPGLAVDVAGQLGNPALQGGNQVAGAAFVLGQAIALHHQPLQHRGGNRLLLAQRRQGGFSPGAGLGGRQGTGLRPCRQHHPVAQLRLRYSARLVCLVPAAIQQQPLGPAQPFADFAVPCGGAGLACQGDDLLRQRFDHIIDAQQIGLGPFQFQLGLVAALIQAGNARSLLQYHPARGGAGVDQFGNLALADQRRRMRPG